MKKILFMATAVLAVAFTACGNKTEGQSADTVTDTVVVESEETQAEASGNFLAGMEVAVDTVGYTTTPSGLMYKEVKAGTGAQPAASDVVKVHYTGKHLDGTVFDSSVERGEPATFPLDQVIAGWTEGVQLMNVGSKYQFLIPSELAYKEKGTPGGPIQPNEPLYFEVELLEIEK